MPHPRALARTAAIALFFGAIVHASCRTPTQIELVVTTDLSCAELKGVAITVGPPDSVEARDPSTVTTDCRDTAGGAEIGTLVIAPDGEKDKPVGIRVVAGVNSGAEGCNAGNAYAGCIVARRRLQYVPHTELVLQIPLSRDCLDEACNPESTCVNGDCKSSTIADPEECTGKGCGEESLGGGDPGSGGAGAGGVGGAGGQAPGAQVELLPLPPDATDVDVLAVSDDGETLAGTVLLFGTWTPCVWVGSQPFVLAVPGGAEGRAEAVSDDGQRVVGWVSDSIDAQVAILWERLGPDFGNHQFVGETEISRALACDDGCDMIAGEDGSGAPVACVTEPVLDCVPVVQSFGAGLGLSGDGALAVGHASNRPLAWRTSDAATIWEETTVMGGATAVTDDGSVLVGSLGNDGFVALVANDGVDLPLTGGTPLAVAGNAASWVAVGTCMSRACKWEASGPQTLIQDVVAADYQGTTLETAVDITADGTIVVGVANGPLSEGKRPYRLTLVP
jgi:hypothetical protein